MKFSGLFKARLRALRTIMISFAVLVAIWQIIYITGDFNEALFPSPTNVVKALWVSALDGSLYENTIASMCRFAVGYIMAVVSAILLGLFLGTFKAVWAYINPIVQLLRPISPMAWMPFIVLWLGIGDVPAVVIIFIAAFFPVLLSTVGAISHIDKIYFRVASNFGIGQPQIMWKIIFPAAFPQIASGINLALGTAWIFLVCGEMVGAQTGLGYLIIDARNNMRADMLAADIVVIGCIGLLLNTLLRKAENILFKLWGIAD